MSVHVHSLAGCRQRRSFMTEPSLRRLIAISTLLVVTSTVTGQDDLRGYEPRASGAESTRLDWIFTLANQSLSEAPAGWLSDYDSKQTTYELFVPQDYSDAKAWPLVLFVSPGEKAMGYQAWGDSCAELGVILAGPQLAGNNVPGPKRHRMVMDVLDDVRRRFHVDTDRTYIAGFSGGGRVACAIAFAVPEYFGGVIPVCAGGDLRSEPWLRQRVIDRLSVAHLTGETDFNRGEVERLRQTVLSSVGVRTRCWVADGVGHAVPGDSVFRQAFEWLEAKTEARRSFARKYPAARINGAWDRKDWSDHLLTEARKRIESRKTRYAGLMQLKGIHVRWNDLPAAGTAFEVLKEFERADQRAWEEEDIAEQRRFLVAQARGLTSYATGPMHPNYQAQRPNIARAATNLWLVIVQDGQDEGAVMEAKQALPKLKKLFDE